MKVFVGDPDEWRDYSSLQLDPADLYDNVQRGTAFNWSYQNAKLGKPGEKAWGPFYPGFRFGAQCGCLTSSFRRKA